MRVPPPLHLSGPDQGRPVKENSWAARRAWCRFALPGGAGLCGPAARLGCRLRGPPRNYLFPPIFMFMSPCFRLLAFVLCSFCLLCSCLRVSVRSRLRVFDCLSLFCAFCSFAFSFVFFFPFPFLSSRLLLLSWHNLLSAQVIFCPLHENCPAHFPHPDKIHPSPTQMNTLNSPAMNWPQPTPLQRR